MLIGYSPPPATVNVSGADATNMLAMIDGRPSSVARIAGAADLRLTWSQAASIRIVAALGLTCAAGTELTLTGKRMGDAVFGYVLGGNSTGQTVVDMPDGSRAAWFVLDAGNEPLIGIQLHVAAAAQFDVGELVAMPAVDVTIEPKWQTDLVDPSVVERTLGGDLNVVSRRVYRRFTATFTATQLAQVRAGGLAAGMDWETLRYRVSGAARTAVIPRGCPPDGSDLDIPEIHRTALYGRGVLSAVAHLGGNQYTSGLAFEEIPPL